MSNRITAKQDRARFLAELSLKNQGPEPIELSFGTMFDGNEHTEYVEIKAAPGVVLREIFEIAGKYGVVDQLRRYDGILVTFADPKEEDSDG
ncbi:MAG: hypothetical protein FWE08_06035 [Oscillospiraceae bacterium]|nr:hypothetical protein [Oscillospiraceae bacterium]